MAPGDTGEKHLADTLEAGAGLAHEDVGRAIINAAGEAMDDLKEFGASFDRKGDALALTLEGGHSEARIAHARGDSTGIEIVSALVSSAAACGSIRMLEGNFVVDLIGAEGRCSGAIVMAGAQT